MLAFLLAASSAAQAASVLERVEVSRESAVSVTLRLSAPVSPVVRTLPGNAEYPARVYLDFPNTILDRAAPAVVAGDARELLRVRTGQFDASTTRIVLELSSALPYRVRDAGTTVTVEITPPHAAVAPPQSSLAPSRPAPATATVPAPPLPAAVVPAPQRRAESTPAPPPPSAPAPAPSDPVSPVAAALVLPEPLPPTPAAAPAPPAPVAPAPVARLPARLPVADAPASPTPAAIVTPPPTPAATTPAAAPAAPASPAPAVTASESPSHTAVAAPAPPGPVAAAPAPPDIGPNIGPDIATAPYLPPPGTIAPDPFPQVATAPAQPPPAPLMRPRPGPPFALTPTPPVVERPLVVLDAGHGGHDPGAIGLDGVVEKTVTLDLAQRVAARLRAELPVDVVLTRDDDTFVPIDARVDRASEASLFVSLHANAAENPHLKGVEVFYGGGGIEAAAAGPLSPERLGRHVAEAIERRLAPIRTTVRPGRFGVLARNAVPSILIEVGYITNPGDVARIGDESYRGLVAQAIADGTAAFLRAPGGVRRARRPVAAVDTCPRGGTSCRSGAQASARSAARS
jgi:N-acetylmuramoyl-L-alanine amidase